MRIGNARSDRFCPVALFAVLVLTAAGMEPCGLNAEETSPAVMKLPPAPALPELSAALADQTVPQLDADDYATREAATRRLMAGGPGAVPKLLEFVKTADHEGRLRALRIVQQLYLKMLRFQFDDEALALSTAMEEMRQLDPALLGPRMDVFHAIHFSLLERSSVRTLVRLNAVLEFKTINRPQPGIQKGDLPSELPQHILIGENWLGDEEDFRHVEALLRLGEMQFGDQRTVYRIQGCPIPMSRFQDLVAGLPGVFLEERSRARLGIGANSRPAFVEVSDWEVTQIHPGSAAAHAGLKLKDIVIRLNEDIVNTFQDLTVGLEAFAPPDVITLDVLHDPSTVKVESFATQVPASLDDFGLTIDQDFRRFTIIKEVRKDSAADQLGLTPMMRIEKINQREVTDSNSFLHQFTMLKTNAPMTLSVRRFERIPVTLRGWVGPYR